MKLEKILDNLGSFEKGSFLKIIENIYSANPKNKKQIDQILLGADKGLKSVDGRNISQIFSLVEDEFAECIKTEFRKTSSQLDIVIDIIIKDGHGILKQDWFSRLYENELKLLKSKIKSLRLDIENEKSEIDLNRKRDYRIYEECLKTAYKNDTKNNQENKITNDEQSILTTIAKQLELSQEEVKLINYSIVPVVKLDIDHVIESMKNIGIIFYSKKTSTIYVADEMVRVLRKVRKKELADKYSRRVLRLLREPQINLICKMHNIDRKLTLPIKINEIIQRGVSLSNILIDEIHKEGMTITEKKKFLNEFCDKSLGITPALKGATLDEKMTNLLHYFETIEKDDRVLISHDGYAKLLHELGETLPKLSSELRKELEFQEEQILNTDYLLDRNLKPADILDLITNEQLDVFCKARGIKTRGDLIANILDNYKDAANLFLENYDHIGYRRFNELKENGLLIREAELGLKFEEITKSIFHQLGFNVDEKLRRKLNTTRDKVDVILSLNETDLILVECKTIKDSSFSKFSSVSRQLKAYRDLIQKNDYRFEKCILVAPEFTDDFINGCQFEPDLKLSLITSNSLLKILDSFKKSKYTVFPHNLIRDVLVNDEIISKALAR